MKAGFVLTDVHIGCDSNIPLVAQELMKKMVRQFALEYACKCLLDTSANGVTTRTSSPLSATADGPLDLTVSRTHEKDAQSEPGRKIHHIDRFFFNQTFLLLGSELVLINCLWGFFVYLSDAVLDLSNRNSAASSMFSSTQKASG